jgi:hypothetical protein
VLGDEENMSKLKIGDIVLAYGYGYENDVTVGVCKVTGFKKMWLHSKPDRRLIPFVKLYTIAGIGASRRCRKGRTALHPISDEDYTPKLVEKELIQKACFILKCQLDNYVHVRRKHPRAFGYEYRYTKNNLNSLRAYLKRVYNETRIPLYTRGIHGGIELEGDGTKVAPAPAPLIKGDKHAKTM